MLIRKLHLYYFEKIIYLTGAIKNKLIAVHIRLLMYDNDNNRYQIVINVFLKASYMPVYVAINSTGIIREIKNNLSSVS